MEPYHPYPRFFNINYQLDVGKNASLMNTLFDCAERITIGDNVAFGHDCQVLTGSHDYSFKGAERMVKSINKPIKIGNGVWIASRVTICQGVTIGDNAVIGAGSVVLKDVPANQLWAGVPAKYVKDV